MSLEESASASVKQFRQCLGDFSDNIRSLIDGAAWDGLGTLLAQRQMYIESVLSSVPSELDRDCLKKIVVEVLAQDMVFQEEVQVQKNKLIELQFLLDRGKVAIKAYKGSSGD